MEQIVEYQARIALSENFVLIQKDEYKVLKGLGFKGNCVSVEYLRKKHTCLSRPMFNELILLNPKFKKTLDIKENPNGCVAYPKGNSSGKYYILESKLLTFIEENFPEIFTNFEKNEV